VFRRFFALRRYRSEAQATLSSMVLRVS